MKPFASRLSEALEHFRSELSTIRTGRANPSLVEQLNIECYGSTSPLIQVASISVPEPQLLVIAPWDPGIVKDIERAIQQSSLGLNPVVDGKTIRLPFPSMTAERRDELSKVAKEKAEKAKIVTRGIREDELRDLKEQKGSGALSEDAFTIAQKKLQEQIDKTIQIIQTMTEQKIEELHVL